MARLNCNMNAYFKNTALIVQDATFYYSSAYKFMDEYKNNMTIDLYEQLYFKYDKFMILYVEFDMIYDNGDYFDVSVHRLNAITTSLSDILEDIIYIYELMEESVR
jgi:coproporphyrinogen III oxidase